jgi:hypothetical protein
MVKETFSAKGSFRGWRFQEWLKRNKDSIKLIVSIGFGFLASQFSNVEYIQLLFGGVGAVGSKLIIDTIDFWATDVELPK